ncbi:tRNA (guanosine(46)-N7)-methyltransferase TrmB [Devriesea agamarum]|uniref:tRNA (guanosine(46)-N7)-methyltransferase TrmB n=1 Tax=Devriesea agamarum TaxID=472569 RepID=UPI000B2A0F72|nr:tRNA (guanosine(46)-N7)-methyltransferase TrmB [Devriesea agamarum]
MPELKQCTGSDETRREVVSFVRRGSRLSPSRQKAWDDLADSYVLTVPRGHRDTLPEPGFRFDLSQIFGRTAPLIVEIGSGLGDNIALAASKNPDRDHLAFEVYRPGIAQTLSRIEREGSPRNIRMVELDAQHSVRSLLPAHSVSEFWVFFPDPWHKTRHHKRRIIQASFLNDVAELLKPGGVLRLATDWADYAAHMRSALDRHPHFEPVDPTGPAPSPIPEDAPEDFPHVGWSPRFTERTLTSFERKAITAGRLVWDLTYRCAPRTP